VRGREGMLAMTAMQAVLAVQVKLAGMAVGERGFGSVRWGLV